MCCPNTGTFAVYYLLIWMQCPSANMELNMEIMDMSLDEYIAISKKSNNSAGPSSNKNNNRTVGNNDAKFGRRKGNIDDEEEDEEILLKSQIDEVQLEGDSGIWKGPDASVAYIDCHDPQNDLRGKLTKGIDGNTNNNNKFKEISSIQYRLKAPNNCAERPRGIPTLLPLDAYVPGHQRNDGGYNNKRFRYRNRRGHYRGYNNNLNNHNNNNNNKNYNNHNNSNNYNNGMGGVNNGRIQRNRIPELSKNSHLSFNGNGSINDFRCGQLPGSSKNIVIQCSSNSINLKPDGQLNPSLQVPHSVSHIDQQGNKVTPFGNLTPEAQAALNLNPKPSPTSNSSNDNLKSLLGFQGNVSGEMMPVFASRLLEFLQNGGQTQVHKPIYDMKIQKEIHEIQNKPLLYKCNGGEVISSDGAGVSCKIIPRTSGVSLNCRFG